MQRFAIRRLSGPALFSSLIAAALLLSPSVALGDAAPAFTSGPTIAGDAVVGATLTAVAKWTGVPDPIVKYSWRRCPATGRACDPIADATAAKYVVRAADLGFRLGVTIHLKNKIDPAANAQSVTTDVVVPAPSPAPTPSPSPSPGPPPPPPADPDPTPEPVTPAEGTSFTEPVAPLVPVAVATRATLLRPFPVVRIRGYFKPGGVRVTLLSVNAPRAAHITARCVGRGCPVRTLSMASAPARLRPFERFLPAGTVLQVSVTHAGRIGKYASFVIRARSAPLRRDLCLMPGRATPAACPTP